MQEVFILLFHDITQTSNVPLYCHTSGNCTNSCSVNILEEAKKDVFLDTITVHVGGSNAQRPTDLFKNHIQHKGVGASRIIES